MTVGSDNMQTEDEGSISGNDDNNKGDTIVVQPLLPEPTCRCAMLTTKAVELSSYREYLGAHPAPTRMQGYHLQVGFLAED